MKNILFILLMSLSLPNFSIKEKLNSIEDQTPLEYVKFGDQMIKAPFYIMAGCFDERFDYVELQTFKDPFNPSTTSFVEYNFIQYISTVGQLEAFNEFFDFKYHYVRDEAIEKYDDKDPSELIPYCVLMITDGHQFQSTDTISATTIEELKQQEHILDVIKFKDGVYSAVPASDPYIVLGEDEVATYITSIDELVSVNYLKSLLKAYDEYDGDITNKIVISEDNYTDQVDGIGEYTVTFSVTDNNNNTETLEMYIEVCDLENPEISGTNTFTSYMSDPLVLEEDVQPNLSVSDNYDTLTTDDLVKTLDTFTGNEQKVGTYTVTYTLTDSSSNSTEFSATILVKDDIKPVISGAQNIETSYADKLEISTIMGYLSATDNVDGDISKDITVKTDTYSEYYNLVGNHSVTFTVTDSSNNTSEDFVVNIAVFDHTKPVIKINKIVLNLSTFKTMTQEEIINLYLEMLNLEEETSVEVISNTYFNNENKVGSYKMSIKIGDEETEIIINVLDDSYITNLDKVDEKIDVRLTFFERLQAFFMNLLSKIIAFFKKLFTSFNN